MKGGDGRGRGETYGGGGGGETSGRPGESARWVAVKCDSRSAVPLPPIPASWTGPGRSSGPHTLHPLLPPPPPTHLHTPHTCIMDRARKVIGSSHSSRTAGSLEGPSLRSRLQLPPPPEAAPAPSPPASSSSASNTDSISRSSLLMTTWSPRLAVADGGRGGGLLPPLSLPPLLSLPPPSPRLLSPPAVRCRFFDGWLSVSSSDTPAMASSTATLEPPPLFLPIWPCPAAAPGRYDCPGLALEAGRGGRGDFPLEAPPPRAIPGPPPPPPFVPSLPCTPGLCAPMGVTAVPLPLRRALSPG